MTDLTGADSDPMDDLIRRADAYAHTQYYGRGLTDCLADNRKLAEEAKAAILAEANEANAVLQERVAELEVALVDAQGAPHTGCCPDHDWRGPGRDTSAEACEDIRRHEAETHGKEADRG